MDTVIKFERATVLDGNCRLTVHVAGTPLARPGLDVRVVHVSPGTPLVWVIGMLAADARAYDRFTELVDRGAMHMHLDGQGASWWQEVERDGVLVLLYRSEGVEVSREVGGIARLDPERPLTLETCDQALTAE